MNPIAEHPTHKIYDSSKLQEYMTCPRKYFYKYVLGWANEDPNIHLVFGEAWHRAMEVILWEGGGNEALEKAYARFIEYYRKSFTEIQDGSNFPKVPGSVIPALVQYTNQYAVGKDELIATETAGTVPIAENRVMHYRLDSIYKGDKGYYSLEHKTGSRLSQAWLDQWTLKVQVGTYTHSLLCMYPQETTHGVIINGAIFRKKDTEFLRVPVRKTEAIMNAWLWNVNHLIDLVEWNMAELKEADDSENILRAFPMNTEACMNYGRMCEFHDFCSNWANPLQRCEKPPIGYVQKWWNPAERESTNRKNIEQNWQDGKEISVDKTNNNNKEK